MDANFWLDKWQANQIAFHSETIHPMLLKHWDALALEPSSRVFVPLCGKSKDMVWLRNRGHEVVGVELSEIAAEAFFAENAIEAERSEVGLFTCYSATGYRILCGDFFDLTSTDLGSVGAIYDRAALIALDAETRIRYARHLRTLCESSTQALLITVDYPSDTLNPPPFIVGDDEVARYYGDWCEVRKLGVGATKVKGVDGTESAFQLRVGAQ